MHKKTVAFTAGVAIGLMSLSVYANPEQDLQSFRDYFAKKFPTVEMDDFGNGVYALDANARSQWEAIEEFPPYEANVDDGEALFNTPFANGGVGVRQNYPYFDAKTGGIVTLEGAINDCRVKNGEKPLGWKKGEIADLSAYMAYTSRGNKMNIKIPDDPRALAIYERGKRHFYSKRGQLNFACADCHLYNAGQHLRSEVLSPSLGHVTHFPVYRSKWGNLGTLHRRYAGCNKSIRAKPFKAQGDEYKALEYFESYMSNGLSVNGPGQRQ